MASKINLEPVSPEAAIRFFRDKVSMSKAEFELLLESQTDLAFTVARVEAMNMVNGVFKEVDRALADGTTMKMFKDGVDTMFDNMGVTRLSPWHLDTVFRTNVQTAYSVGRFEQMEKRKENFPMRKFNVVVDAETSEICEQLAGGTYPANDPIFDHFTPPNHFNCRTTVTPLHKRTDPKLDRKKIKVPPDKGFNKNPAKAGPFKPDLKNYPPGISKQYVKEQAAHKKSKK